MTVVPTGGVSPLLVGRCPEIALLRSALDAAAAGRFRMVLVGGEAGVGKSRLITEQVGYAVDVGHRVLLGSCVEGGGEGMSFAPVVDILRTLVRTTPDGELDAVLGRARPEIARLLPEIGEPGGVQGNLGSSAQLFELLLGVLVRLADAGPVLVVIEDLHWADQSTLDFVAFLARALTEVKIMLLVTYRSDEMHRSHPLRPLLATWERSRQVTRTELARFSADEVRQQLSGILGTDPEEALSRLVVDRSEGNAFLVEEVLGVVLAGADPETLPPSLRDVLLTRVDQLSDPARQILRTASVAGRWVPERLLATVTGLPPANLYAALREAVERHQLVVDDAGQGYAFRHALTRDAVYTDLLPGERSALHLAYAEELAKDPELAGPGAAIPATLAYHWYAALDLPRALVASVQAARAAAATAAFAEAQRHLERAVQMWPRVPDAPARTNTTLGGLLTEAGIAAFNAGQIDRALTHLDQALASIAEHGREPERAVALERRATVLHGLGNEDAAAADLQMALDLLAPGKCAAQRAGLLAMLANTLRLGGNPEAGTRTAHAAVTAAREAGRPDYEADALVTLGTIVAYGGDVEAGIAAVRRGIELAEHLPKQEIILRAYANLSDLLEHAGDHEQAASVAAAGAAVARDAGFARSFGVFLLGNQMEPLVQLGRWDEAEHLAAQAMRQDPTGVFRTSVLDILAQLAAYRGDYDLAEQHLRAATALAADSGGQYVLPLVTTRVQVQRARGELLQARESVRAALADGTAEQDSRYLLPLVAMGLGVEADLRQGGATGDPDTGESALTALTATLESVSPSTVGERAFAAVAAAELGRTRTVSGSVDEWRSALAAARDAGVVWLRLYVLLALARALAEEGNRPAAADALRELLRETVRTGAQGMHDEALRLARRARLSISEPTGTDAPAADVDPDSLKRYGLTDRERVVLSHVAAGSSNGQIAAALFISPKTASVHVSNILAKLGVSGRGAAAAVAHRAGIEPPGSAGR